MWTVGDVAGAGVRVSSRSVLAKRGNGHAVVLCLPGCCLPWLTPYKEPRNGLNRGG